MDILSQIDDLFDELPKPPEEPKVEVKEAIDVKKASMGEVVKDFRKSKAPQFKGKSNKKKQEMAVAAKLQAEEPKKVQKEQFNTYQERLMGTVVNQIATHSRPHGELKEVPQLDEERFKNLETQLLQVKQLFHEATMVSGIGQGGDGQTPGSGVVKFFDLDDVTVDDQLLPGQGIIWDGDSWVNGNGSVVGANDANVQITDPQTMMPNGGAATRYYEAYDVLNPSVQKDYNFWIRDSFTAIEAAAGGNEDNIADLATRIEDIEAVSGDLGTLSAQVATNTSDIAGLISTLAQDESRIEDNTDNIADNAAAIALLQADVAQNTTDIANNLGLIQQNTADIGALQTDVATNTGDIASLNSALAALELDSLTDVDTSTTPATDGQALIWDAGNSVWVPGDVATDDVTVDAAHFTWNDSLIPDTNSAYDLGSAEYKVRHLFLSDNSVKFESGDLGVAGGNIQFAGINLINQNTFDQHALANDETFAAVDARLNELEINKGSIKQYDITAVNGTPTVRGGEMTVNNTDVTLVTSLSIGITDKQGNSSHIIAVGDIIEVDRGAPHNDEVRYLVSNYDEGLNIATVSYVNSVGVTTPFGIGDTLDIYTYPQNQADAITEGELDAKLLDYIKKDGSVPLQAQSWNLNVPDTGARFNLNVNTDQGIALTRNNSYMLRATPNNVAVSTNFSLNNNAKVNFNGGNGVKLNMPNGFWGSLAHNDNHQIEWGTNGVKVHGALAMNGGGTTHRITNLSNPTDAADATTKSWVEGGAGGSLARLANSNTFTQNNTFNGSNVYLGGSTNLVMNGDSETTFQKNAGNSSRVRFLLGANSGNYFKVANGNRGCFQVTGDHAITSSANWNTALTGGTVSDDTALVTKGYVDSKTGGNDYSLPTASTTILGGVKIASTGGTWVGASRISNGTIGVVEATNTVKGVHYKGQCAVTSSSTPTASQFEQGTMVYSTYTNSLYVVG